MEQENRLAGQKRYLTIQEKNCSRSKKKKTSSISKILKSLVNTPYSTRTVKKITEKIKHKKRLYHPRLTMKYKEKRLEYAR